LVRGGVSPVVTFLARSKTKVAWHEELKSFPTVLVRRRVRSQPIVTVVVTVLARRVRTLPG
jgi:hypothetical protein